MAKKAANRLSLAQIERLAILSEECGEVVQAIGKILRHGYKSKGWSNKEDLETEIGNIMAAVERLHQAGDIDMDAVSDACSDKLYTNPAITHHQG